MKSAKKNVLRLCLFLLLFSFLLLGNSIALGAVWYVDGENGTDPADCVGGDSWATAFKSIQKAIDCSSQGDEIRVASGTYALFSTIHVNIPVAISGGWDAQTGERDWQVYETIVDGQGTLPCFYVSADATIDGLTITRGYTGLYSDRGGGITIINASSEIANCTLSDNRLSWSTSYLGAGGLYGLNSLVTITNSVFVGNDCDDDGFSALHIRNSTAMITNSIFLNNVGIWDPAVVSGNSSTTINNSTFSGNGGKYGGAIISAGGSMTITDSAFSGNYADRRGIAIRNYGSSMKITNCTFSENLGGGTAPVGVIYNENSSPEITNCTFWKNYGHYGLGVIDNYNSSPSITNCTFWGNWSDLRAASAVRNDPDSSPIITNSILWGNDGDEIQGYATSTVTYSDIDQDGFAGSNGNIRQDPLFVDQENGDLHITRDSPCRDAGTDQVELPDTDFEGDPRIVGPAPDMGADEFTPSWTTAYRAIFNESSDLELLRQYRDQFLIKTVKGELYTKLLYETSDEALEVLTDNPQLMLRTRDLIEANKQAFAEVLNGNQGVIHDTEEILSFLEDYADESPLALRVLANMVKREMLMRQQRGKTFLGFELR